MMPTRQTGPIVRRAHEPDRANRRQPPGFRESVGEVVVTDLTAAVAHLGRCIMDAPTTNRAWITGGRFPELAARYSLIVPFASVAASFVLIKVGQLVFHEADVIVDIHALVQ